MNVVILTVLDTQQSAAPCCSASLGSDHINQTTSALNSPQPVYKSTLTSDLSTRLNVLHFFGMRSSCNCSCLDKALEFSQSLRKQQSLHRQLLHHTCSVYLPVTIDACDGLEGCRTYTEGHMLSLGVGKACTFPIPHLDSAMYYDQVLLVADSLSLAPSTRLTCTRTEPLPLLRQSPQSWETVSSVSGFSSQAPAQSCSPSSVP